jgi:nucleoredoxin
MGNISLFSNSEEKTTAMDLIKGKSLMKVDGSMQSAESALAGKDIVMFYFSAHWCPPCRGFTPILKEFYEEVEDEGVELIFVSCDRSKADMISYMKESHGDWFGVEHGSDLVQQLSEMFGVSGIPYLVVVKSDGTLITKDGRSAVQGQGPTVVKSWKK